ncbi:hypothetical protein EZS27_004093 [termite gut metagenome]|uniref:HTH cro/C1-type domain-containing protein n=1 Tax=termite gut metagenome TaxID=433724 RepID=A0A5J4STD8_9ZZZZ
MKEYSENYSQLLAAIKKEIDSREIKQVELANFVGIKNSTICSFLSGGRTIPSDKLIDLLYALDIKLVKKEETIEDVVMQVKYKDLIQRKRDFESEGGVIL